MAKTTGLSAQSIAVARVAPLVIAATLAGFAVFDGANNGFMAALLAMAHACSPASHC
jgi:hypothetical protein